jgi:hypothetical protein
MSAPPGTELLQLRCARCRYGASCRTTPDRCPMCGSSIWHVEELRDFATFLSDLDEPLSRDLRAPAERGVSDR